MKRSLALILCLVMLIGVLAACNSDEQGTPDDTSVSEVETTVSDGTVTGDPIEVVVNNYTIIRSSNSSATLTASAVQLKKDIDSLTGGKIGISEDWVRDESQIDDAAYEILVGTTNRKQSTEVAQKLTGAQYAIEVVGNKIVITGTNDYIVSDAVNYFIENYVKPTAGDGKFTLPGVVTYVSEEYKLINLIENKKCLYSVVYNDKLDNTSDDNGKVDYQVELAKTVREKIIKLTNAQVTIATDWAKSGTDTSDLYEILIGTTERPESAQARAQYGVNEYGISIIGNKIVVTGWNEKSIGLAVDLFLKLLESSVSTSADGGKTISFLENTKASSKYEKWSTDIPEFEGGTLYGCVTCNNDDMQYYYTDTTEAAFGAYRQKLEGAGYKLYSENNIGGNLFATYTNNSTMVHTYYVKNDNAVRIITGSNVGDPALPDVVSGPEQYTKITESKITQMTLHYESGNFGMCYIVTLEDGSFIVFDGGGSTGGVDHIRLYNLLNKLNERPDGKIVIAAWILTHSHWDHFMGFYNLCTTYGSQIKVERYIANVPDSTVYHNSGNPNLYMENGSFDRAAQAVGGIKLIKPYTGMKFWIRNAEIEVLYSHEALYPTLLHTFNDSTMVTKMKLAGQTIAWLGDVQAEGSRVMCDMYDASVFKSDIVQVAHHGHTGATKEVYKRIDAAIALWPTDAKTYANQTSGDTSGYKGVDYYLAKNLNVVDIFVADPDNICITLPYTPGSGAYKVIDVPAG